MNKPKVVVLGAGLVGSVMAIDLSEKYEVTSVDRDETILETLHNHHGINAIVADFSDTNQLKKVIAPFDLVIGAVPGFLGFQVTKAVIESGKNMVDISFMPEDFLELDELAKEKNVTVINDCGVAPGMGNIILGYHHERMEVDTYECLVGGLPVVREWPYEYKAVFSPIDVIEEYTRLARYIQNGEMIVKEALSDPELIFFDKIGTLESWNSDGLRSLARTMKIPNMIEKTLRYPGCIEYLRVLKDSGYFSYDPVEINGLQIRPIDMTSKLLFDKWKLKPGEEDFTIMRIVVAGKKDEKDYKITYDLLDRYDKETSTISMARTTGFTCTAVANLLLNEKIEEKGICPPEYLGKNEDNFLFIMKYLAERGVHYHKTIG
ncbi:saccharopine dehydrogenase family protein [Flexithrix dorotheae]|uniref:saccharopine dehydrogenase family protein n=1 Tax=Flexithrix dorotheae TaxID=70993 RepID=UPI00035D8E7D|nr:saccharopine dehydrogenase C-terminal domain-containing protein [Flexithrix dorotheae]